MIDISIAHFNIEAEEAAIQSAGVIGASMQDEAVKFSVLNELAPFLGSYKRELISYTIHAMARVGETLESQADKLRLIDEFEKLFTRNYGMWSISVAAVKAVAQVGKTLKGDARKFQLLNEFEGFFTDHEWRNREAAAEAYGLLLGSLSDENDKVMRLNLLLEGRTLYLKEAAIMASGEAASGLKDENNRVLIFDKLLRFLKPNQADSINPNYWRTIRITLRSLSHLSVELSDKNKKIWFFDMLPEFFADMHDFDIRIKRRRSRKKFKYR
jgi:hypothetical protein